MKSFVTVGLCASLVALAIANPSADQWVENYRAKFDHQKERAAEIEERFGSDVKLLSIGAPQVLVLQHRTNPTPYAFIEVGIDNYIVANTPGGFEGWFSELEAYDPDVIAFGPTDFHEHQKELMHWLNSNYRKEYSEEQEEPWTLYVKNSLPEVGGS
jgi:hypothetical protein